MCLLPFSVQVVVGIMRVVVTGGGGYVGYHVGWVLSRGGHHVILLDLTPPDPEWQVTAPLALHDALSKGQVREREMVEV